MFDVEALGNIEPAVVDEARQLPGPFAVFESPGQSSGHCSAKHLCYARLCQSLLFSEECILGPHALICLSAPKHKRAGCCVCPIRVGLVSVWNWLNTRRLERKLSLFWCFP